MRYLHVVQAHERYLASGRYRFLKNGEALQKHELWTMHELGDNSRFVRIDLDAREAEGKSILAEALLGANDQLMRFDIRYENRNSAGGIRILAATYQFEAGMLQVGYAMNGEGRRYLERDIGVDTLVDIPFLVLRGGVLAALSAKKTMPIKVFVPMFEQAQLFPGVTQEILPPVEFLGDEKINVGGKALSANRYRYRDKAVSYWVDKNGTVVKRVNSYKWDEFVVLISDYARWK